MRERKREGCVKGKDKGSVRETSASGYNHEPANLGFGTYTSKYEQNYI